MNYDVLREHLGDRMYVKGETREAEPARVSHLVKAGVLREAAPDAEKVAPKAAAAVKNKAVKVPQNKADNEA